MLLLRPWSLLLLLPLAVIAAWLLRRGGALPTRMGPTWLFDANLGAAAARRRRHWRDPLAWGVIVAAMLWIAALAAPQAPPRSRPSQPALVLLDAGAFTASATSLQEIERTLAARRQEGGERLHLWLADGPDAPFTGLDAARHARPDLAGATLEERLRALAPSPTQPVDVFSWSTPPASRGAWRAHALHAAGAPAARLVMASWDAAGRLCVACATGQDSIQLQLEHGGTTRALALDHVGRAETWVQPEVGGAAGPDSLTLVLSSAPTPAPGAEAARAVRVLSVRAPAPTRVWLLADEESAWADAVAQWPGCEIAIVERGRLPGRSDVATWSRWREQRGRLGIPRGELLVIVGDPIPAPPDSLPWLWIAPRAGAMGGLRFGDRAAESERDPALAAADAALSAADAALTVPIGGLELASCARSTAIVQRTPPWSVCAGGRLLLRGRMAAVLNVDAPRAADGSLQGALAALRLARLLVPPGRTIAGPGLPSPPWQWPPIGTPSALSGSDRNGAEALDARGRVTVAWVLAALLLSLLVLLRCPWSRARRLGLALVLGALTTYALRRVDTGLLLVLDASPSCRGAVPAATAREIEAWSARAGAQSQLSIAALDGEGGRWLLRPTARRQLPFAPEASAAWLQDALTPLPQAGRTRLLPALSRLLATERWEKPQTVLVSDGHVADAPDALAAAIPAGTARVVAVPAGRPGDAAMLDLHLDTDAPTSAAHAILSVAPGSFRWWLDVSLDGVPIERQSGAQLAAAHGDASLHQAEPDTAAQDAARPAPAWAPLRFVVNLPPLAAGGHQLEARLTPLAADPLDAWPANDALAFRWTEGPTPSYCWVLPDGSRRTGPGPLPRGGRPDVWILDAAPESLVAALQPELLRSLDAGSGLLLLAGPGSWLQSGTSGRYALEDRLPVRLMAREAADSVRTAWIVLLDASGSMATVEDGTPQFDRALLALASTLASAGPSERVGLVVFADRVLQQLPPRAGRTREQVEEALRGIRPSGGTRLLPALQAASSLLGAAADPTAPGAAAASSPARAHIVVLSDGLTGDEPIDAWLAAVGTAAVTSIEVSARASLALRTLSARTGGRHLVLESFTELASVLTREVQLHRRERFVSTPLPLRAELAPWAPLLPRGPVRYAALTPATSWVAWSAGAPHDPILSLGTTGPARCAVLATTAGPPWAANDPHWEQTVTQLIGWLGHAEREPVRWDGGPAPRLRVADDPRPWSRVAATSDALGAMPGQAPSSTPAARPPEDGAPLVLVGAAGDSVALEAVLPGVYRPRAQPPLPPFRVIDPASGGVLAQVGEDDPVAELRAAGVDQPRLAALEAALAARNTPGVGANWAGAAKRAGAAWPLWLAAGVWLLAAAQLARERPGLAPELPPATTPGRPAT